MYHQSSSNSEEMGGEASLLDGEEVCDQGTSNSEGLVSGKETTPIRYDK